MIPCFCACCISPLGIWKVESGKSDFGSLYCSMQQLKLTVKKEENASCMDLHMHMNLTGPAVAMPSTL